MKFWGVRGTIPVGGFSFSSFGGNTSCVEIDVAGRVFIFDAGSGLYSLGKQYEYVDADILLSHTHIDHIIGFPYFKPFYNGRSKVRVWAGHLLPERDIRSVILTIMSPPIFPLVLDDLKASIYFCDFKAGEELQNSAFSSVGVRVKTLALNHPDRATGYRIEHDGKSVCYITDIEHDNGLQDKQVADFVRNADVLIYDSTYSDIEYQKYKGWGHSTWQQGAKLAKAAKVKRFVAFHHDPEMDDVRLRVRALELSNMLQNAILAREGMVIEV